MTDMLRASNSDPNSKRKMVEILRRCNLADDNDDGDDEAPSTKNAEFLGSVLESVDLRDAEYEDLEEGQRAAFRQAVSQGRLDHLIDIWSPWWISATVTGLCSQPSPIHLHPIPPLSSLCKTPPSAVVGNVLIACTCCYAVLMRVWNGEPDSSMAHALLSSCTCLSKQDPSSLQLQSADFMLNDCFSCLCDAAVGLSRAAIPAAIADLLSIFASRHFILSALSDVHRLLELNPQLKGSAYSLRKVFFLLSFVSAISDEELQGLVGSIRNYGEAFVNANQEARVTATQARSLIQEIS